MGAFKECARKYELSIKLGFAPRAESVHITFGLLYHAALERYDHAMAQGQSHEAATITAVRYVLTATWNSKLNRPWISDDKNKNRLTLLRSVVWYLEQFANDPIATVILADGKPAVELSFRFEIGLRAQSGEDFLWCGHLDRLGVMNDKVYILDKKTTKNTIDPNYFEKYTPDNQFSGYTLGGRVAYSQPIAGLIVDAVQVAITFSRFQRGLVQRTEAQLEEWHKDLMLWLRQAEGYARDGYWPQNDKSCGLYGGCPYRGICSKSPAQREQWLKADYITRVWDPLQIRGDI